MLYDLVQSGGVRLDLAMEMHDLLRGATQQEVPGVREDKEQFPHAAVTTITIMNPQGAQMMNRPMGTYITIDSPDLRFFDPQIQKEISSIVAQKLKSLLNLTSTSTVLLVGLGNWNATPDALGPKIVEQSVVTRHLFQHAPEALSPGMSSVCAIAPGVLGITGIETAEILKGVVEKVRPEVMIVIDALSAKSVDRIGSTIQIANTGISPGSGVGNQRQGINQETMGVPVIAIGCPTVVHAAVIMNEAMEKLLKEMKQYQGLRPPVVDFVIKEVLGPFEGNLTVTPKEVDSLIQNLSATIAGGINQALHPQVNPDNFALYLQ